MDYVNEFCAESLTNVEFNSAVGFELLKRPFANVEELEIDKSFLQKKCLGTIFPKLQRLRFPIKFVKNDFSPIITDFPNLQHFEFNLNTSWKYAAVDALRNNSHVKSLRIGIPSFSFLQEISDLLQSVESLEIDIVLDPKDQSQVESNPIHFQNVKKFCIAFSRLYYDIQLTLPKLPFLFDQSKEFVLDSKLEYNDFYNDFLSENPTIEKLSLDSKCLNGIINPEKLQKMLPSLKEINLSNNFHHIDSTLQHWANDLKSVKRFSFACGKPEIEEKMKKIPINEWHQIYSLEHGYCPVVTLERIEALTHNMPFNMHNNCNSSRFYLKSEFKFCNCDYKMEQPAAIDGSAKLNSTEN